jgi:RNA polymerase sigma-70 factor (ECF subfamily)
MNSVPMNPSEHEAPAGDPPEGAALLAETRVFRSLVVEHAPHLRRVLRSLGIREADLDDVCQELFIVAYRKLRSFEGRSSLRTWLCGIAIRVASDHRSRAYRRLELPTEAPPVQSHSAEQESALERKRAWQLLEGLLSEMPQDQRNVFVLYEIAELSVPEVADALGCPAPTAYSRLYAAREHVERRMTQLRLKEQAK